MVGFKGRPQRRRAPYLTVLLGAVLAVGSLIAPTVAGAQDTPPVEVPGYCGPLSDVLDNAYELPIDDEDYQEQQAEGARLLAELRAVAPNELTDELDALDAFAAATKSEIAAAGGIGGLTEAQRDDLIDRSIEVLDPVDLFYSESCPGANIDAVLYPECDVDGSVNPPELYVDNFSDDSVEVVAGDVIFTVDADDFDSRQVAADLQADEVLIDGISGLVQTGTCDDFFGDFDIDFNDIFVVTYTPGCPDVTPPRLPRVAISLTPEGQESIDEDLEVDPEELRVPFDIDDFTVLAKFPAGLNLMLEADAGVPEVSFFGSELRVAIAAADCSAPTAKSAPSTTIEPGAVAKPLSPKFTG